MLVIQILAFILILLGVLGRVDCLECCVGRRFWAEWLNGGWVVVVVMGLRVLVPASGGARVVAPTAFTYSYSDGFTGENQKQFTTDSVPVAVPRARASTSTSARAPRGTFHKRYEIYEQLELPPLNLLFLLLLFAVLYFIYFLC